MKLHILNFEPDRRGGGWTAARYLAEGLGHVPYQEASTVLICGPTMASYDQVEQARRDGKIVILRLDNAVRDSRNRGTGMTRMKKFAEWADLVIYQSAWARDFLYPFLLVDGPVILNGADPKIYNSDGRTNEAGTYLYARSSRDEGKQWIMAWYWFVNNPGKLEIVGKFSPENMEYNFDFYNGERYIFTGEHKNLAEAYKRNKHFLYTYLNDACSNTLIEAKMSGCEIIDVYGMLKTGGAPEIMACEDLTVDRMIRQYKEEISRL